MPFPVPVRLTSYFHQWNRRGLGLACVSMLAALHNRRDNALGKAARTLPTLVKLQHSSYIRGTRSITPGGQYMVRIIAVALIAAFVAGPAFAKVPKGCRSNQQEANRTGECSHVIIENLDRGSSSTAHFYRNSSHKSKKHRTTNH